MEGYKAKISDLKPNPSNPRIIRDEKFLKLVKSIKEFPKMLQLRPIVVNDDMVVLGGNMRLKACKEAGLKEIPVIKASSLTEDEQREFIIKDNVGFGEWDWEMLANDWDAVQLTDWGLDIPDFAIEPEATEDDFEIPETVKTDIVPGDLFEIGEHRLLCGDSTNADDVAKLMNGQKADMVFTDPPYNVDYEGNYIQSGKILKKEEKIWQGGIENDKRSDFAAWLLMVYETIDPVLKEGAPIYIWHPSGKEAHAFWKAWLWDKWHFQVDIIWNKLSLIISRWDYKPQHEPCMYGWKGKNRSWAGKNNESTVWDLARQQGKSGEQRGHPTQKPVGLPARAINNHSVGIIADFFLGSGTTMVAAHQLNRKCYGMELDPKYCQIIVDRMLKLDPSLQVKRNGIHYGSVDKQPINAEA